MWGEPLAGLPCLLPLSWVRGFSYASFQPPAVTHSRETTEAIGSSSAVCARGPYCRVNPSVPLLRLYFREGDLRKDFRLSRPTMEELIHLLGDNDHGWGKAFEVLVKDIQLVFRRVIRFPTRNELEEIGAGFQQLSGSPAFNKVAGSIDGCHVRIVPPGRFAADYFNRKLFHCVQFQAICDHAFWMSLWDSLAVCMMPGSSGVACSMYTSCTHLQDGAS
ncbi:putative nuclease HARBI1 [Lates japonicus]|uniref:Nuclease HARBI1 n=1 Tax=Lates japonicus TaxID=270547 RepID=A0AAD3NC67_LATJO|nr:putative nuclease HARBI1 [Lates japonicus]